MSRNRHDPIYSHKPIILVSILSLNKEVTKNNQRGQLDYSVDVNDLLSDIRYQLSAGYGQRLTPVSIYLKNKIVNEKIKFH